MAATFPRAPFIYRWVRARDNAAIESQSWVRSGNALTFVPRPFRQTDWPVPPKAPRRKPHGIVEPFALPAPEVTFTLPPLYAGVKAPPPPNVGFVAGSPIALTAAVVVADRPALQLDWPNPKAPRPTPLTWADSFKLPLQQALPAGAVSAILPPRASKPLVIDWFDSFKLPLQQVIQPNQYDWPNPVIAKRNPQDWLLTTSVALAGAVQAPFAQLNWPNPRGWAPLYVGWLDSFKLPLQQVIQPNQYNWPNPVLRTVQRQDWFDSFKLPLQQVIQSNQYDWSNPVLRTVQRQGWGDSFKLPIQQTLPPRQTDWPNPVLRTTQRPDWILPQPYVLNVVTVTVNPGFNEWGVPDGARVRRQDWIFPQPYTLNVAAGNPFVPLDWPNPSLRTARRQDWIQATSIALSTAVQAPFAQSDWPNPRAARPPNRDWQDSFKLPLQQTLPPRQLDWPVPMGARRGRQDWFGYGLPGTQAPPNNQTEWPNPQRVRVRVQDWIAASSVALTSVVTLPFAQTDWPNPSRRKVGLLPTWTDWFKLPLQQTLPPRQLDWPNPRGPRQPVVTARDFIAGIRPSPPIPPVYDAQTTLKNEIRRLRFLDNKRGRVRFIKNEIRR